MKKRSILNTPKIQELKRKKRKVIRNRVIFFFVIFLLVFVGIGFLSRIRQVNISNIEVIGNKVVDKEDIEEIARENIKGNYFFIFKKSNSLIYPRFKIKKDLEIKLKRLKDIDVSVDNLNTLKITVDEYTGQYLYCGEIIPETRTMDEKCYFIDSTGYIFDEAPFFSGDVYFKFYGKLEKENGVILGNTFYEDNFVEILRLKDSIEKMNLNLSSIYINDENEININLSKLGISKNNPKIILKKNINYEKEIENLQASITTEPLLGNLKTKYSSLLYIDLRFGNKVYYKFE